MTVYTIPIHVPIYTDGSQCMVISEWKRALELLRDSFDGAFEKFILISPSIPAEGADVLLEPLSAEDGFDPRPSIPQSTGKKEYWLGGARKIWRADMAKALDETDFAHTVVDDLYRPLSFDAARMVAERGIPHVFFIDTDIVSQERHLVASGLKRGGPDRMIYLWLYERAIRERVSKADVSFLKGKTLMDRYAKFAKNPVLFHNTAYQADEVVPAETVEQRLAERPDNVLRLVYCGRLVARKGCDQAIKIVKRAREMGAEVSFDIIGTGDAMPALQAQAQGIPEIRFLGERPYGPDLLRDISAYDGLLFTPVAEDTPRMIFDGYAAGLPLIGNDIPYVQERAAEEGATVLLPTGDIEAAARKLVTLAKDGGAIAELARAAHKAGERHASDHWYKRRADATLAVLGK